MRPCDVCGDEARFTLSSVAELKPRVAVCWACHDAGFAERLEAGESAEVLRRESFDRPLVAPPFQAHDDGPLFAKRER